MSSHNQSLAATFMFDADDLAANRSGRLSAKQVNGYRTGGEAARRQVPKLYVMVTILMVGLFVLIGVQSTVPMDQKYMIFGILLLFYALILGLVRRNYRMADKMENLELHVAEGTAKASPTGNAGFWKVTVGGKKFAMTSSDTDCFHEGVVYRIYYTDIGVGSLAILSAEAIG